MAWLAEGSSAMVVTPLVSGSVVLLISAFIDPLFGLGPLLGVVLLCGASWLLFRFRDPPRRITQDADVLLAPIDGTVVHLRRERPTHRRPEANTPPGKVIEDLGGGPWIIGASPSSFATEQRFVPVQDEGENDVWCLRIAIGPLDLQVHRAPMAGTVRAGEHRRAVDGLPERLRWVVESKGRRVEVLAHLVRPRFALTPLAVPGDEVRRGQRLAFMSTTPMLELRVPADAWTPATALLSTDQEANGQEVQAGTTVLFHPLWDAEE
jgi:hypothetical protein